MTNPTTPYQTLGNIRGAVITDAKEQSTALLVSQVNRWVNEGYEQVAFRKKRDWLDTQFTYQLPASTQATAHVISNSTTVTFGATATMIVTTAINVKFYNKGFQEIYNVSSISGKTVTLEVPYLGTTATAVSCVLYSDSVNLDPSIRMIYSTYHQWNDQPVVDIGPQDYIQLIQSQGPQLDYANYCTIFSQTTGTNPSRQLRIFPYPNTSYTIYVTANTFPVQLVNDSDQPAIPMQYRQLLYWYALYKLYSYHRNDTKASEALSSFSTMLGKLDGETRVELDFPKIQVKYPRTSTFRRFAPQFDIRLRDNN